MLRLHVVPDLIHTSSPSLAVTVKNILFNRIKKQTEYRAVLFNGWLMEKNWQSLLLFSVVQNNCFMRIGDVTNSL